MTVCATAAVSHEVVSNAFSSQCGSSQNSVSGMIARLKGWILEVPKPAMEFSIIGPCMYDLLKSPQILPIVMRLSGCCRIQFLQVPLYVLLSSKVCNLCEECIIRQRSL